MKQMPRSRLVRIIADTLASQDGGPLVHNMYPSDFAADAGAIADAILAESEVIIP